jgi:hypothetical protein
VTVDGVVAAWTEDEQVVGAVRSPLGPINDVVMMSRVADPDPATAARITVALVDCGTDAAVDDLS